MAALTLATIGSGPALAGLAVSPLIVDIGPGQAPRGDVELRNTGEDRLFVVVEPARIEHPGQPDERRLREADPAVLGLIATPNRLILQPGERKFVRLALLNEPADKDRIFRVVVKPVVGSVSANTTGLKLLVGFDMLVIQRPQVLGGDVTGHREGDYLVLINTGNTNVELFRGKNCTTTKEKCSDLPSERIYSGQVIRVPIAPDHHAKFMVKTFNQVRESIF